MLKAFFTDGINKSRRESKFLRYFAKSSFKLKAKKSKLKFDQTRFQRHSYIF